jgi:hypothetical protein
MGAERPASAAARDQYSSRRQKDYLRSMLLRRQLQALVRCVFIGPFNFSLGFLSKQI